MGARFKAGDLLFFQIEAAYALIRIIGINESNGSLVWHVRTYEDLFPDVDSIESAVSSGKLTIGIEHIALTERAFDSTQVAFIGNVDVDASEMEAINEWRREASHISDRSIRLHMGLR